MSATSSSGILRPLLFAIILLVGFVALFLMYFKPARSWLLGPLEEATLAPTAKNVIAEPSRTVLLLWLWPFGAHFNLDVCSSMFSINSCHLTADRNLYNLSDAVIFHHRDIRSDMSNLPPLPRPFFQKWIWMNLESPTHTTKIPGLNNLFNLTLNYRLDADIEVPYGSLIQTTEKEFVVPSKSKMICWIVSNWNPQHKRSKYYHELKNHVEIHVYGSAFGKRISDMDFSPTIASCKFYLSFENSVHKDYITEKLYNPLAMGSVPIVLGPSRKNYENFVPGDAFIHVDDFPSPKEMAAHLLLLDKNEEMYRQYFRWRKYFTVRKTQFWAEHMCRACEYIRTHKEYKVCNNLDSWYWG
ncbi:4-galactosyl-N-acetylglucosaminide 3-alpha-L-fucosyltransferase 9-like [Megalops cyprinoides]|uniref:4-galactosyl-N-acetylglucosaminide 3-alpha-L-fucosyltransferase 9-like n=1 Tax=Megalops cyprinoides TaxID=118141 RepID=UPI0018653D22|nr:4-galactosyl-N-acetylglucosaminide 3-alpha-L-fucosyltransferase 9-like [Megalops cyprinoides]XP_036398323.1 4-galactosyl-N-acetylglucosaminide 3-alpha-L-fucosyltransferase 9-like [Megalops cyprinoides]